MGEGRKGVHDRPHLRPSLRRAVLRPEPHRAGDLEINELEPDLVVCSGDLTTSVSSPSTRRRRSTRRPRVRVVCCHSRKPRLTQRGVHPLRGAVREPELGARGTGHDRRGRLDGARSRPRADRPRPLPVDRGTVRRRLELRIFVLHHHLLPVPGTGRERNVVYDAGDAIECLQRAGVQLVLSGHKHVPYAWRLENIFIVNTGTVSSLRLRGNTRPCYNVVEIEGSHVDVWRRTRSTARRRSSSSRPRPSSSRSTRPASSES